MLFSYNFGNRKNKTQILRKIPLIVAIVSTIFFVGIKAYSQNRIEVVKLDEVVNVLSSKSSAAQIEKLNYQNVILQFENYKKSFLPTISLNFNSINFNRSLRLFQQPTEGSYSDIGVGAWSVLSAASVGSDFKDVNYEMIWHSQGLTDGLAKGREARE